MQTLGFGVTKRAALPNTAAVCGRSTFHSEQRCTEQLCRQVRTCSTYTLANNLDTVVRLVRQYDGGGGTPKRPTPPLFCVSCHLSTVA